MMIGRGWWMRRIVCNWKNRSSSRRPLRWDRWYTEPLCGSFPLQKILEIKLMGPMFTRASPSSLHNTINDCVGPRNNCAGIFTSKNYWKTTLRFPCSPLFHNTINHCLGIRIHLVSQFPCKSYWNPPFIAQTTTLWLDGTTVWVNSYVNTARNHCGGHSPSKNQWNTIFWTPCVPSVFPPPSPVQHKQWLCR